MRKMLLLAMGMLLLLLQVQAQDRSISGKVTDQTGGPVPNASITVKGTSIGTTSSADGSYTLKVPSSAKILVFSSVGMAVLELPITESATLDASLTGGNSSLTEVVVVAYGTQKKVELTGVVAEVKAKDIENKPFTSVDKALQGQIAGLQSVAGSGAPGAAQAILIRGMSSITASNQPLWVIDGIPVNTGDVSRLTTTSNLLSTLNPNDIESISVLKDAASASIYGSRAANGVIVVTTRRGKSGKTRFRADTEVGQADIAYVNDRLRPLTAAEYFTLTAEGLDNAGASATDKASILASLGKDNGVDYNWYDNITRKGNQQQYNLSAEGGNEKTTFYLSGGYFVQEGTSINSKLERTNGNVRVTHKLNDKLSFNLNVNGGYVNQRTPLAGGAFGNPVLASYFLLPSYAAYNPDGSYNLNSATLGGLHNTIALSDIDKRFLRELSLRGNVSVDYKILPNLKFRSSFSGDFNTLEEDQYNNPLHGDGQASGGRAFSYYTRFMNRVWTNTLDFQQAINNAGDIYANIQAGYEYQISKSYNNSVQSQLLPAQLSMTYPAVGATPITASASASDYSFLSQFSSANINFKDRYIISGSVRRDGSSRFGADNKYGTFWSVGASWNVDRENFMSNFDFFDQLKVRASYGVNGNAGIGNYDWRALYGYGFNYNQQPGSAPANIGDSGLTWELNKPFNVGIDVGVFRNRISLSVDYYVRKTEDLLLDVPVSRTTGFSTVLQNVGAMENKGIEVTLNAIPVKTKDFSWNVNFNFANNKNTVTSLPGGNDIITGSFILRQGQSIQSFYLREYAGVNPTTGEPEWYTDGTHETRNSNYSAALRAINGTSLPKYFGSLTNSFNFRGFSLEAQLYYNFGNYVQDQWGGYYLGAGFGAVYNKVARTLERWTTPGQETDIPRYVYNNGRSFQSASSFYLNKGDFIRLRNIQVGYDIPRSVLERLKLNTAFFYVRGTNLWTWVKDENLPFDPEQGTASQSNLNVFIPKTLTVGLNLTF